MHSTPLAGLTYAHKFATCFRMRVSGVNFLEKLPVIPAKAGIHMAFARFAGPWIPAFAGMTGKMSGKIEPKNPPATNTKYCKLVCID